MSKRETEMYADTLEYVLAVTKMLNSDIIPYNDDYYIKVQLIESGSHRKAGEWIDEIAPDCWSFAWAWEEENK